MFKAKVIKAVAGTGRAFSGVIEISSGAGNGLIKLMGLQDSEEGRAISEVLFYLEMLSLNADLTAAIRKGLTDASKKAVDNSRVKKVYDDYIKLRKIFKSLFKTKSEINALWRKRIKNKKFRDLKGFYNRLIKEYPDLVGKNFSEFKTKIFRNGKQIDEITELSSSGKHNLDGFIKRIKDKKFLENVKNLDGRYRVNDSEIKYIYHFLTTHLQKGDYFIIETTNIMTACGSCRQEFLILKELLGDKVKIIVNSVEELEQVKDVENFIK